MKKALFMVFAGALTAMSSCSSHDAELEKDLNARIDKFGAATVDFCNCVSENKEDCEAVRVEASKAMDEMVKLHDLESEQNIDPEIYSKMLESAAMYKTDYFTCSNTLRSRMH